MNPKRRTAQIEILAQGISRIGPEFERFGAVFMDALLEVPMTHAGIGAVRPEIAHHPDSAPAQRRRLRPTAAY